MRSSARSFVLTALAFPILALGCAWSGGDQDDGECNPTCLAECRSQCTNSVDADEYDQCSEGCDCGCD